MKQDIIWLIWSGPTWVKHTLVNPHTYISLIFLPAIFKTDALTKVTEKCPYLTCTPRTYLSVVKLCDRYWCTFTLLWFWDSYTCICGRIKNKGTEETKFSCFVRTQVLLWWIVCACVCVGSLLWLRLWWGRELWVVNESLSYTGLSSKCYSSSGCCKESQLSYFIEDLPDDKTVRQPYSVLLRRFYQDDQNIVENFLMATHWGNKKGEKE